MMYLLIGLVLFLAGCLYPVLKTTQAELQIVQAVQAHVPPKPFKRFFQEMWLFGLTTFTLAVLALMISVNWKLGLVALSVFSLSVGIERLVKDAYSRQRPFQENSRIAMLQPREPLDPSYPSGDALRIWFLTLIVSSLLGSPAFWITAAAIAIAVSLGRMVMGVHYPSDILGGAGLGLVAGGITIWLWQIFHLIG
jgi:membrane-associated phospholipid phosphatase